VRPDGITPQRARPASLPPHAPLPEYYSSEDEHERFVRHMFDATAADYERVERLLAWGSGSWYRRQALRRADLMRQAQSQQGAGSALRNGEIEILVSRREVRVRGQAVELTALEFDLLLHFAQHPGHVFARAQLLDAVWGYAHEGYEHTVTTHINRLRAKLESDPMRPTVILTVRGAGYKMRDAPP